MYEPKIFTEQFEFRDIHQNPIPEGFSIILNEGKKEKIIQFPVTILLSEEGKSISELIRQITLDITHELKKQIFEIDLDFEFKRVS